MKWILFIFLLGCSSAKYTIGVDSYGNDERIERKTCVIYTTDSSISSLQFQEYKRYLTLVLWDKGYRVVDNPDSSNVSIFFDCGISDPARHEMVRSLPTWGVTGTRQVSTSGTIYVNPYSGNVEYNQEQYNTPSYGVIGYRDVHQSTTLYRRFINLVAFNTSDHSRIWQVAISSTGSSGDLRKTVAYMLVGAKDYIGNSSGEIKKVHVNINNEQAKSLLK